MRHLPRRLAAFGARTRASLIALLAVTGLSATASRADSPAMAQSASAAIAAAHQQIDADIGRKDLSAITKLCTPDFRHVYPNGQIVLMPQYLADTRKQFQRVSTIASATQVTSVTPTPFGADDTIAQRITAVAPYRILFVRRHAQVTIDYVIDEQWVRGASGGWLLRESRTITDKQHVQP